MSTRGEEIGSIREINIGDQLLELDPQMALNAEIYVLLKERTLTFLLFLKKEGEVQLWLSNMALEAPTLEGLKKVFYEHPLLSLPYKASNIYFDVGSYTLVPKDLDHSGTPELWSSIHSPIEDQFVLSQIISTEQMVLHYSVPLELYNFCQRSFSLPTYGHSLQPMISFATRLSRQCEPNLVMTCFGENQMDVIYVSNGQLQLCSRYQISSEADILYFITALWRQFFLSQETVPLYIYGHQPSMLTESLMRRLKDQIGRVVVGYFPVHKCPQELLTKHKSELPPELIIQLLCE